jgi:lipoate-protein ligase A
MFSHGTLLFRSDLSRVAEALKVRPGKIESKGIKSIRSRVANISDFFENNLSIEDFRAYLLESLFPGQQQIPAVPLSETDWIAVEELAQSRYRDWNWNFGSSPAFNVQKVHRFPGGEIDMRIEVKKGLINCVAFYGDYFSMEDPEELAETLKGMAYTESNLAEAIRKQDVGKYFIGVSSEDFVAGLVEGPA